MATTYGAPSGSAMDFARMLAQQGMQHRLTADRSRDQRLAEILRKRQSTLNALSTYGDWRERRRAERAAADGGNDGALWGGAAGAIVGAVLAIPTMGASLALTAAAASASAVPIVGGAVSTALSAAAPSVLGTLATGALGGAAIGSGIGSAIDKKDPAAAIPALNSAAKTVADSQALKGGATKSGGDGVSFKKEQPRTDAVDDLGGRAPQATDPGIGSKIEGAENDAKAQSNRGVGMIPDDALRSMLENQRPDPMRAMVANPLYDEREVIA